MRFIDDDALLIREINNAKEEHYNFLISLDLSNVTNLEKQRNIELASAVSALDSKLMANYAGDWVR